MSKASLILLVIFSLGLYGASEAEEMRIEFDEQTLEQIPDARLMDLLEAAKWVAGSTLNKDSLGAVFAIHAELVRRGDKLAYEDAKRLQAMPPRSVLFLTSPIASEALDKLELQQSILIDDSDVARVIRTPEFQTEWREAARAVCKEADRYATQNTMLICKKVS